MVSGHSLPVQKGRRPLHVMQLELHVNSSDKKFKRLSVIKFNEVIKTELSPKL